jgi:hypothetical protein
MYFEENMGYTFPAHTIIFATHTKTLFSTKGT